MQSGVCLICFVLYPGYGIRMEKARVLWIIILDDYILEMVRKWIGWMDGGSVVLSRTTFGVDFDFV